MKRIISIFSFIFLSGCIEEPQTSWYSDTDTDGYGDPETEVIGDKPDNTYISDNTDCDDTDANINPSVSESVNLIDDDCDEEIDNGFKYVFCDF